MDAVYVQHQLLKVQSLILFMQRKHKPMNILAVQMAYAWLNPVNVKPNS